MKILFVAPRVHPNQVPIIQGFINKGDEVYYCVAHKKNFEKYAGANVFVISPSILHKNYNKYIIKKRGGNYAENSSLYKFIPCVKELKNVIRDIKPNLVVIRNRSIFSLYTYIICKQLNIKKVLLYNQTPIYKKKQNISAKKLFNKFAFSLFPKKRITVSRYNDSHTNNDENIKDKNAYFVPFVARKVDSSIKKDYFEKNLVRILDSGKYRDYKNHFLLISLAKVLREQGFSNFRITIQGQVTNNEEQKYYNELLSQIKRENLDEYVELKKGLDYDKMQELFLSHDLFILASKKEVANISILDAMAYGLPAISTSANGTADYISNGYNGAIYKSNNLKDLNNIIMKYLKNPETIIVQGRNARRTAKEDFNFEAYYKAFMKVYNIL